MKHFYISALFIFISFSVFSQIPSTYYNSANGLSGSDLKQELHDIITSGHTPVSYTPGVWNAYYTSDVRPEPNNTEIWDMYSDQPEGTPAYTYTVGTNQCGSYSGEGSCYNREHSFPKSWFGGSTSPGPGTDIHHIVASDGYVNGKRSNYAYGEISNPTWTSTNGSKVGDNSYPGGFSGTAFEPIDEYKGDFARIYFYMATRYKDEIPGWVSSYSGYDITKVFQSNGEFQTSYYSMLFEWHTNDPVSEKELNRDTAIYNNQGNANPFISHPEWVQCIWSGVCPDVVSDPENFTSEAVSETQINLSWILNADNDNVVLAYNTSNTFGSPNGTYTAGQTISGGGEVIYAGSGISFNHSGLTNQNYYYKIWSVNSSEEYSSGVEINDKPLLAEPTNTITDFTVFNETSNSISLSWTDATGGTLAEAYLIKASTSSVIDPTDGIPESDGIITKHVLYGVENITFPDLDPQTTYNFNIYPYTNTENNINYKTDNVVSTSGSTTEENSDIFNVDFSSCVPAGWTVYSVAGSENWVCGTDLMEVNAFGGDVACNDWFISPAVNFNDYSNEILTFNTWTQYSDAGIADPEVSLKYSVDYTGSGNPEDATWSDLTYNFPGEDTEIWTGSDNIDLSSVNGSSVYLAFVYVSSGTGAGTSSRWYLDDIILTGILTNSDDKDSQALPPDSQITGSEISSLIDTEAEAVEVFSFKIQDSGTSDGIETIVNNIRVYNGLSNTADWTDAIQGVVLSDGSAVNINSLNITDSYINIQIAPNTVNDGSEKTFTLSVWLNQNDLVNGSVLSFIIDSDNHGFIADDQYSEFASVFNSGVNTESENFTINDVSGIKDLKKTHDLITKIIPNPADNKIKIRSEETIKEVKIFDIYGKEIYKINGLSEKDHNIIIHHLQKGLYILEITHHNNSKTVNKFIKR